MEFFTPTIGVVKLLLDPLTRQIDYIKNCKENVDSLQKKMEMLTGRAKDVSRELDRADLGGKIPKNEVANWLKRVEEVKEQERYLKNLFEEKKHFFNGYLPNYYSRRKISRRATKMIAQVDELQQGSSFEAVVAVDQLPTTAHALPTTQSLIGNTANLIMKEIWQCLMNYKIRIIGIQGIGGVGKTTVTKHVYNRLKDSNLFGSIIWVSTSKDLNLKRLQSDIAKAIKLELPDDDNENIRAEKIHEALLRRKNFVIFLDDLWKAFSLEDIGIPEPNDDNGCKIVLTTRLSNVCKGMQTQSDINMSVLSKDEAWDLFRSKVGNEVLISSNIQRIARLVAEECGGLPLALITVGVALRKEKDVRVWSNALEEFRGSTYNIGDMHEKVFTRLKFSYDRLKDKNVQACFLYCSLYPEDHEIRIDRLIDCWIWEGFTDEVGDMQIERNRGYSILNELKCAGMLEGVSDDQSYVKMHDLIRDMAISITSGNPHFMAKAGVGLKKQPKDSKWVEDIERISLAFNELEILQGRPSCPKLSTLFLQGNRRFYEISSSFFHYMHGLRVVDLSNTSVVSLPESLSDLVNLRALYLTNCSKLVSIPSLAKLKELRVLHLDGVNIKEPPQGMESLVNLRCLNFSYIQFMFRAWILPKLSVLEELSVIHSSCRWDTRSTYGSSGIDEITGLTQLRKLSLSFLELPTFLSYVGSGHWHMLKNFNFFIGHGSGFGIQHDQPVVTLWSYDFLIDKTSLLLPNTTVHLYMIFCIGFAVLAEILLEVKNLKRIQINYSGEIECIFNDGVNSLLSSVEELELMHLRKFEAISKGVMPRGGLASLKVLRIDECDKLRNVFSLESICHLQNLEEIYVECCGLLEEIIVGKGDGHGVHLRLKILQICDCPKLKTLLSSELLQSLKNLEEIKVFHCDGMEQMVVEEDELCQVENAITLPRLQRLSLEKLPNLKYISERSLICNSLHNIKLKSCPQLKNLSLSIENPMSIVSGHIVGSREWLDGLEWDDNTKTILQPLFLEEDPTQP